MTDFERENLELQKVMGDKFQDVTREPVKAEEDEVYTCSPDSINVRWSEAQKPREAQWQPPKAEPTTMQRVVNAAKWTSLFASLSLLFFYWQQSGQMQPSAAVPCMCACTAMVGWAIGKNMVGGAR